MTDLVRLLRAEWTKFRTVRGWVVGTAAATLAIVLLGLLFASFSRVDCRGRACPAPPVGPYGQAVSDRFTFVHQPLDGDGSLTVRVTSMSGLITYPPPDHDQIVPGVVAWAKAGLIVKQDTRPGSAYAAVMATAGRGVRMQHNFTQDTAGRATATFPLWLRLTRAGEVITGYESADGRRWTRVGAARLSGLGARVQIGLFVTCPDDVTAEQNVLGGAAGRARLAQASAGFDQVTLRGTAGGRWSSHEVGHDPEVTDLERYHRPNGVVAAGGGFTVTGTGDIAPSTDGLAVERTLFGVSVALVVVIVVAVSFFTAEYRRGLFGVTLLASPRRGRVLAAKAVVIGAVTFAAGLLAAGVTVAAGTWLLRANGTHVLPVSALTHLRVVVGTAALLAVSAVFALVLGVLWRRGGAAVVSAVVLLVLPYVLAMVSVLPVEVSRWLLRLTPAAAFAIQQSIPQYPQVLTFYAPVGGFFPLAPWAGLGVLCGYTALALGLSAFRLRRRDA